MTRDLSPIDPETALESYLQDRSNELSPNTLRSHRSRLTPFVDWCVEEAGLDNLNDLTGRHVHRYKVWRFDETEDGESYSPVTIKTQLDTIRVFAKWLASIDAVPQTLPTKIRSANLGDENQRSDILAIDRAKAIVEYHDRYEYASVEHILAAILWETGCRIGGAHSLDVDDCHLDPADTESYVEFRHRPPETTLKNGPDGERLVSISQSLATVIGDYLKQNRIKVVDEAGRDPLFTSKHGRYHKNTLRNLVYGMTRPCVTSGECLHAREINDCEAMRNRNDACKCPSSKSPHAVRRSSITYMLREGTPTKVVSDRANIEVRVLEDHYDSRTPEQRMETRREHIPDFHA